jgi:hypothetical protein
MTARHPTANASQRARRATNPRIDYYPSPDALAVIESRRTRYGRTNNNSGIIDTIIAEWSAVAGIEQSQVEQPETPANRPEFLHQNARVRMSPGNSAKCASVRARTTSAKPDYPPASPARVRAEDSGSRPAGDGAKQARVICGAKRRRDGQPCQALSVPGKRRCKWHGGASTGPRTDAGRTRSIANLRQYQNHETELATS